VRNLLRAWTVARRTGDVLSCRRLFGALVDTADADLVALLREQLDGVEARLERGLRTEFAEHVRARRYPEALTTGDRLAACFPDGDAAEEYITIRPYLLQRVREKNAPTPMDVVGAGA
jgi:hypothetical protein